MALILTEPFENFTAAPWTVSSFTIVAGRTGTGAQSSGTSNCSYNIPSGQQSDVLTIGFAVKVSTLASQRPLVFLRSSAGVIIQNTLTFETNGSLTVRRGNAGGIIIGQTVAGLVVANTYYYIELQIKLHNTLGVVILNVNGVQRLNLTGLDTNTNTDLVYDQIYLTGASAGTHIFDDLYLRNDTTFQGDHPVCNEVLLEPFNSLSAWTTAGTTAAIVAGRTGTAAQITAGSSLQYDIPTAQESISFTVGFAYRVASLAAARLICQLRVALSSSNMFTLRVNADGSLQALGASTSSVGISAVGLITVNTWYYLELKVTISNTAGFVEARINGTTVIGPTSGTDTNAGFTEGQPPGALALNYDGSTCSFDDFYLTTGGCAFKGVQALGVNAKVWNGSAFVDEPVKVYNGSAFVDALAMKTWNGSAFV